MSRFAERPVAVLAIATVLLLGACGSSTSKTNTSSQNPAANDLQATVASFDVTAGPPHRFLIGLQTGNARLIGFGTVQLRVHPTDPPASGSVQAHDATFLAIPATQAPDPLPSKPTLVDAVRGRGVYAVTIGFDRPGIWTAEVDADVEGLGRVHASTDFQVTTKHEAVAVGERAPASTNYTVMDHDGASLDAVDSRAQGGTTVPDPELHRTTIAGALAAHRPFVAVFSTPVYCQSRFCGPITDMVAGVAKQYAGKAAFVHVEIFKDFGKQIVNDAALQWLQRVPGGDIHEPWLYVVGSDGTVKARFDNVVTHDELVAAIDKLL
jgi:hypothetical protein